MRAGRFSLIVVVPAASTIRSSSVRGDVKVTVAVLHEDVGDSTNGCIRYVFTFFFSSFSRIFICFVLCAITAPDIELGYRIHSIQVDIASVRHQFRSTTVQVDTSLPSHQSHY